MKKADYATLARRINEARTRYRLCADSKTLGSCARITYELQEMALTDLARQLALDLSVDRTLFLRACGL